MASAAALAVTAVLATWVSANSAGATVVDHGSRRSQDVAITFNGVSDTATLERLLGVLDADRVRATFFLSPPALRAAPQAATLLLRHDQLIAYRAYLSHWGAWLDPDYGGLTRGQRVFAAELGVCPALVRTADDRPPAMMAAAVRRHSMTLVTWDVNPSGDVTPALLARQVLAHVRPGSIIALQLNNTDARQPSSALAGVDALPQILAGLQGRDLRPVPLDQLLHVSAYAARC